MEQNLERVGKGHFSHKITLLQQVSEQFGKIFKTPGGREEQTLAQHWNKALEKIIRVSDDVSMPDDNPFKDKGELAKSFG